MRLQLVCTDNNYKEPNLHRWGPGTREIYSIHYIISGKGYVECRGKRFALSAGDTFLVFPEEEILYYPEESDPWEYRWIDFKGADAKALVGRTAFTKNCPVVRNKRETKELFFVYEEGVYGELSKERYAAKVYLLLTYFLKEGKEPEGKPNYYEEAAEIIRDGYWKPELTVEHLADSLNVERSYLYRLFMEHCGISPQQYLTEIRMERACELLLTTELSVQAVACSVGYKDALYFSRVFRKRKGITPSNYRKESAVRA
ncbi:MAG: helix-turn-helix domain-containing protein [Lachnospiraceae bacterium]|nr:helix-turn-helix domain-containing protein [Lachnospiraceae bacterium]